MEKNKNKHKIIGFQKHEKILAIDWERLKNGFHITVEHGDALIYRLSSSSARFKAVIGAGIGLKEIRRFFLREDAESKLTEVVLEVAYEPYEKSLGLTDNVKEAGEWVKEANLIVQKNQHRLK